MQMHEDILRMFLTAKSGEKPKAEVITEGQFISLVNRVKMNAQFKQLHRKVNLIGAVKADGGLTVDSLAGVIAAMSMDADTAEGVMQLITKFGGETTTEA